MRVLVTGATGFIGSEMVGRLVAEGHEVLALMRKTSNPRNLAGLSSDSFRRVEGSLQDVESLERALEGAEAVLHLAGVTAAQNREEFFLHNAQGTANLGLAASRVQKAGKAKIKRLVYVSSLAAGGPAGGPVPRVEQDPNKPVSFYGESKLGGETELLKFRDELPITIIRPPLVYGPRDRNVFLFIKAVTKGVVPCFTGGGHDGHRHYSAVMVDDLCRGLLLGISEVGLNRPSGEIYFVCEDKTYTYREMIGAMAEALDKTPLILPVPQAVVSLGGSVCGWISKATGKALPLNPDKVSELLANYWTCSNQKVKRDLGFMPQYDLRTGMKKTVAWYRQVGWI